MKNFTASQLIKNNFIELKDLKEFSIFYDVENECIAVFLYENKFVKTKSRFFPPDFFDYECEYKKTDNII